MQWLLKNEPDDEHFDLGLSYIKDHLPEHDKPDSSNTSDEEDFFSDLKHVQETSKQLDAYLACPAEDLSILTSYPAVSSLSLRLNTALPASAACEGLFSAAGSIFSPERGRMDSQDFEKQLLLKLNKDFFQIEEFDQAYRYI